MLNETRFAQREFTNENSISITRNDSLPGSTLHGHDFYELEIITGGYAKTTLNGKGASVEGGSVIFLSPADFHEYTECENFGLYKIQFTSDAVAGAVLERVLSSPKNLFIPSEKHFEEIKSIAEVMFKTRDEDISSEMLTRLLECILIIISDHTRDQKGSAESFGKLESNMQSALMYIHAHFRENPSLSEVADSVHLNPRYFCTKFHADVGKTYKQYLKEMKLRYARRLIMATSLPIIDIAEGSGYTAQSHFNREFREYYGISPLEMRRQKNTKK